MTKEQKPIRLGVLQVDVALMQVQCRCSNHISSSRFELKSDSQEYVALDKAYSNNTNLTE